MSNSNEFSVQLKEVLEESTKEVKRATNNAMDVVAKQAVKQLKTLSPKKRPEFYKGWTLKRSRGSLGINVVTVYNKTHPGLTHLLNNGHRVVNAKGEVGRYNGEHFMEKVERWANDELPRQIERELK